MEKCHVKDITCTVVRHFELTRVFDFLAFFTIDVVQQSLVTMHSRSRHLWRPIKQRIIPLGQSLLPHFEVLLVLALNMVFIVAKLGVRVASVYFMRDCLWRSTLTEPVLKLRVVKSVITRGNRCLRHIIDNLLGGEESRLLH